MPHELAWTAEKNPALAAQLLDDQWSRNMTRWTWEYLTQRKGPHQMRRTQLATFYQQNYLGPINGIEYPTFQTFLQGLKKSMTSLVDYWLSVASFVEPERVKAFEMPLDELKTRLASGASAATILHKKVDSRKRPSGTTSESSNKVAKTETPTPAKAVTSKSTTQADRDKWPMCRGCGTRHHPDTKECMHKKHTRE